MGIRKLTLLLFTLIPITAASAQMTPKAAYADIANAQGAKIGRAKITARADGVKISIKVSGLTPGEHGIHIHTVGKCEGPGFTTASGHFNPTHAHHGVNDPLDPHPHLGDLQNLIVDGSGKAKASLMVHGVSLGEGDSSLLRDGGTSIVIHARADDLKSDPSGNSGDRIACGVIEKMQ